ncbi:MAG TPA: patatin-like phospholipase family protein [Bryobacteraceae bacterium]|nr:patatin-like phospholipase family protein [Bryobacteraceae bacterium]
MANGGISPKVPDWSALAQLAKMPEPDRRRVLRSHVEAGIHSTDELDLRRRLDEELEWLARQELRAESGSRAPSNVPEEAQKHFEHLVWRSPAFGQYLNTYLYFGVRFAAWRLGNPAPTSAEEERKKDKEINESPVGLPFPPVYPPYPSDESEKDVDRFLNVQNSNETDDALDFLDDIRPTAGEHSEVSDETTKFDLWVRGLLPQPRDLSRFRTIAKGLYEWALQRYAFYVDLEKHHAGEGHVREWQDRPRVEGDWHARNPLAARCGVVDLYWLAKILRADVSPRGIVRYDLHESWLRHLPTVVPEEFAQKPEKELPKDRIRRIEEVLRATFDYACHLIENSVEIAEYLAEKNAHPEEYPDRKAEILDWPAVQDREIREIRNQRRERFYPNLEREAAPYAPGDGLPDQYWSRRIRTGEYEENLVGVALSGGGIRSATFALGVLERLRENDLLRQVDYLSTVSGGGYIGAWLIANVRRTRYWLSRMTSWDESIGYLRDYSKYLSPRSGFLSADSWVIWVTWIRNAFLIQLTAVAWLSALFVLTLCLKLVFDGMGSPARGALVHTALGVVLVVLGILVGRNLRRRKRWPLTQHRWIASLAWVGSFISTALVWKTAAKAEYSQLLETKWAPGGWMPGLGLLFLAMLALGFVSMFRNSGDLATDDEPEFEWSISVALKVAGALCVAALSTGVFYLALCGVAYLFGMWTDATSHYGWYAYVFGPTLVMLAATVGVVVFIGLVGRASADWRREWWTRFGSWLSIFGAGFLALGVAAVFGHVWLATLFTFLGTKVSWGAVVAWAASVVAGLLAGNSNKTRGNGEGSSAALEWVARIGGVLFIAGAVLGLSSLLHFVLVRVWLDNPSAYWWDRLHELLKKGAPAVIVKLFHPAASHGALPFTFVVLLIGAAIFSWRFNLNTFGLNQFYRNRLVRCYLGATRWEPGKRHPERFTGFDEDDDLDISELQWESGGDPPFRGPFPIVNCSLNLGGSSDLAVKTRQSACFTVTPLNCGAARTKVGYAPIRKIDQPGGFAKGVSLGEAISVSGAAASPNMGYNTSPLVSILLTMFNVRLAWWFPNPGRKKWSHDSSPYGIVYLAEEFLGLADETSDFVNVSDGGHFENLGIYELVRRRTKVIIASDAECDPELSFGSLGNVIRICETDFGAKIDIDVASIRKRDNGRSRAHCAVGRITYRNGSLGYLIYLKASITGDEGADIEQYRALHPDFPHQTTADQFFTEDQFESYRRLGDHVAKLAFRDVEPGASGKPVEMAAQLYDVWTPTSVSSDSFVKHAGLLDTIWERFRRSEALGPLLDELLADEPGPPCTELGREDLSACLELTQLMENVFLDLRLDDFWDHPDNRGWAMLFRMWAKSPRFRQAWETIHRTFGIRFEYFCERRLGLRADHPVERV